MSDATIENMSSADLKEQARIFGISLKGNPSDEVLREKIREAMTEKPAEAEPEDINLNAKADWVTIEVVEKEGAPPLYVGVNGVSYLIERGVPVAVPPGVVAALEDASRLVKNKDGDERRVYAHPFRRV